MPNAKLIAPVTRQGVQTLRVAAYCRVSTNSADQRNSYARQIKTYTEMIRRNPKWELVEIFADEGITGMSAEKRPEFLRMIQMCEHHQIDLIITKSVARFARNVKEALECTRRLKLLGIGVQFEEEGINTLSLGDEMLLNLFTAIAQEESKSISQHLRNSIVKRMERGEYVDSNAPYGYRLVQKKLCVYEPEAKVIREIFRLYLNGRSVREISRALTEQGVPTKSGNQEWNPRVIAYILSNEKYIGDSLFQKTYNDTMIPFPKRINHGEVDMYYATDTHEAIIDKETFDRAKKLLEQRREQFKKTSVRTTYPLTSRIRCSECGSFYRRKVQSGVVKWVCSRHEEDASACRSYYYAEDRIYDGVITIINHLRFGEADIVQQVISMLDTAQDAYKRKNQNAYQMSQEIAEFNAKQVMLEQLRSKGYLAPEVFQAQSRELQSQIRALRAERKGELDSHLQDMRTAVSKLKELLNELDAPLEVFDEKLFSEVVTEMSINKDDMLAVTLLGGLRFTELI
ncbi:MAG: recombinase family protein [Oscillospiraceae bacterium]|nr:recombinase family protein [Oscillospiraceae bacterium]